ncbi:hypothetical protein [Paenibacillus spongiae]|uniref:DUF4825 domain-containing protein n=1 Tax=Paenibacillus spongiae TaxID=2909671 RepID=A0ABY5SHK8_9BACL|nr:hypothetical protein [Paenibacillus spongiae]UVI33068.1 hypothetical protein L1F29_15040 [Paenibacillus spongiae]
MKLNRLLMFTIITMLLTTTCNSGKGFGLSQIEHALAAVPNYEKTSHYEVKDEGILAFNMMQDGLISIHYLEQTKGNWKVIDGVGSLSPDEYSYIITGKTSMPFSMTVITTSNPEVDRIQILEEEAKHIQVEGIDLWIAYIGQNVNANDIKVYNKTNTVITP